MPERSTRRIVIHSALFPPTQGGAEHYVHSFSRNLGPEYAVTILTRPSAAHWKIDYPHRIVRLPSWKIPLCFVWIMMRNRPDLLHIGLFGYESIFLFVIARIGRIPCMITYHGTYSQARQGPMRTIAQIVFILENITMRIPWDVVICVDYYSEQFLKHHYKLPQERLIVIPSGVDVEKFRPELVDNSKLRNGAYTLLCPRRIDPKNGIEYLIKATIACKPKLQGIVLLIAGRTNLGLEDYAKYLHSLVNTGRGGSYIKFLGDVEHNRMQTLYNSADIVVIPSLAEARSLSALEAMACERPVIATKVGGLPEIITDGTSGLLVNPGDADDICRAIYRLYESPELSLKLGRNARLIAMQNRWQVRSRAYASIYERLISGKTGLVASVNPPWRNSALTSDSFFKD